MITFMAFWCIVCVLFAQRNLMEYYSAVDVNNMIVIFARCFIAI